MVVGLLMPMSGTYGMTEAAHSRTLERKRLWFKRSSDHIGIEIIDVIICLELLRT